MVLFVIDYAFYNLRFNFISKFLLIVENAYAEKSIFYL